MGALQRLTADPRHGDRFAKPARLRSRAPITGLADGREPRIADELPPVARAWP